MTYPSRRQAMAAGVAAGPTAPWAPAQSAWPTIAGQVDMMFDSRRYRATHITSGRLRAIAAAGDGRAPRFADRPTAAEAGVPGYRVATGYGIFAPPGRAARGRRQPAGEMRKALGSDGLRSTRTGLGTETPNPYGDAFGSFVSVAIRCWHEVVRTSGAKLE